MLLFFLILQDMNLIAFQERVLQLNDWATLLFLVCLVIIVVNKTIYDSRFTDFSNLIFSDKYLKIYKDTSNLKNGFTVSMFFVQLFSFSMFIVLLLKQFKQLTSSVTLDIVFLRIFTFLGVFIVSKYLIEKIIATIFNVVEFNEQFNLLKVNYRTYFGLLLFPIIAVLFYNPEFNYDWVYWVLIGLVIAFNLTTYIITLKTYQNILLSKIFYFILYLCTLEIAPYYFMYYFITKN
jgi:hypothetical protein